MKKILVVALVGSLTACTSTADLEVPDAFDKTGFGVGIGAVAGALGGLLLGKGGADSRNKALIGAGIGALAGGGVGLYMDNQEKDLRAELDDSGVLVSRINDKIIISLPSNISFATGESNVQSEFYPALNAIAKVLVKYNQTVLDVNGYTDNVGSAEFNQTLSEKRALSVANYVVSNGIDQLRLRIRGFGESTPIASNATAEGRAANRRVEIAIVPLQNN